MLVLSTNPNLSIALWVSLPQSVCSITNNIAISAIPDPIASDIQVALPELESLLVRMY